MCGRMSLFASEEELIERFNAEPERKIEPKYNIAPKQEHPVILNDAPSKMSFLRWGLIPSWADDPDIGNRMINARSETVKEKKSFAPAYESRRCLVPADGFYEWKEKPQSKQPYRITLENNQIFAMAGLWERWKNNGDELRTFTIITTAPNDLMSELHNRMPVILNEDEEDIWLKSNETNELDHLLDDYPSEKMNAYPVSKKVNNPENDSAKVIEKYEDNQTDLGDFY